MEARDNLRGPPQERCLFPSDLDFDDADFMTQVHAGGALVPLHRGLEVVMLYGNEG